jgi:DNA repair protein RecO (recombination protein O)
MPLYTADALVLRTYKLGESDRIVVFLTEDRGKKRGVAKGARRPRSKFVGALEPLTRVRLAYFEKERRELVGLNYAEPARSPLSARPEALGHVGYFAELLDEWAQDGDPSERLYRLGASLVDALAEGVSIEPLARYFEFWLLRLQGVYPPSLACQACGESLHAAGRGAYLAPGADVFTCGGCAAAARGQHLSQGALAFLHAARRLPPREAGSVPMTAAALAELEAVHRTLMGRHLDRELRSTRVLRELRRTAPAQPARSADSSR